MANGKDKAETYAKGFALSGDYVINLKDKHFTIIEQPKYIEGQDLDNPEKTKEKMLLVVELAETSEQVEYYPNKTSQKTIINQKGYALSGWVGFQGEFIIKDQKVGKEDKKVIYIKE